MRLKQDYTWATRSSPPSLSFTFSLLSRGIRCKLLLFKYSGAVYWPASSKPLFVELCGSHSEWLGLLCGWPQWRLFDLERSPFLAQTPPRPSEYSAWPQGAAAVAAVLLLRQALGPVSCLHKPKGRGKLNQRERFEDIKWRGFAQAQKPLCSVSPSLLTYSCCIPTGTTWTRWGCWS